MPVTQAYDLSAPFYDDWSWQRFWRAHEYPAVRNIIERFRRGRGAPFTLLDVGCGTGWYLEQLAPVYDEAVGIDLSPGMLAVARHRLRKPRLRQADARAVPFPPQRFDAVICTRVLSHLPQVGPAIREMRRVLAPGGLLLLSDVDADHDYEFTRLPIAHGHILADTFKHDRTRLFATIAQEGFVADTNLLIGRDGEVTSVKRRRDDAKGDSTVGWIAAWRRAIAGDDADRRPYPWH